ncbi:LANO_0E04830g1_1 [Lachancea nothofagi CBS 11611]|uniref:prephenate dehydratase n=1 Tax=Lachancea nothofagi CBS 11611 TaxID=1266666 RepID=A0A1G4JSF2_9SACH|nr:LANO_0E04830g1_1 [Lachancea nothofagi CBS 11611]
MVNVAFLGPLGTYSHQAALQQFPDAGTVYTPVETIPQCFEELANDKSLDYAVVPLENSTNGQVVFTYDILRDLMNGCEKYNGNEALPELEIVAEQYVSIDLCLIASGAIDLTSFGKETDVKVYSHPQVWGQTTNYLKRLGQKVGSLRLIDSASTSGAVQMCCEEGNSVANEVSLAIASSTAANLHTAHILDGPINDKRGNTTRFLTLRRRKPKEPPLAARPSSPITKDQKVSILTFVVKQDSPGSLVDVLNVLKEHQINMCSISSRPYHYPKENENSIQQEDTESKKRKWQYIFFIEVNHDSSVDWTLVIAGISSNSLKFCFWGTFYRNIRYFETS